MNWGEPVEYHQASSCCLPLASGQWCRMMMSWEEVSSSSRRQCSRVVHNGPKIRFRSKKRIHYFHILFKSQNKLFFDSALFYPFWRKPTIIVVDVFSKLSNLKCWMSWEEVSSSSRRQCSCVVHNGPKNRFCSKNIINHFSIVPFSFRFEGNQPL